MFTVTVLSNAPQHLLSFQSSFSINCIFSGVFFPPFTIKFCSLILMQHFNEYGYNVFVVDKISNITWILLVNNIFVCIDTTMSNAAVIMCISVTLFT